MKTLKIRMLRQTFPAGGGTVLAAGRVYDLPKEIVDRLPSDSYEWVRPGGSTKPAAPKQPAESPTKQRRKNRRKKPKDNN